VPHPTWFVKREVYIRLDCYRDIRYCEDYDFLLRALRGNFRIGMCRDVLLYYRINEGGITRSNSLRQFLTSTYLREHLNEIENVTQDNIDNYIGNKCSLKQSMRYESSIFTTRVAVERIKRKHYVSGCFKLLVALFKSKYAKKNISNILAAQRVIVLNKMKIKKLNHC
jgi:hypothetical protein